MNGYQAVLLVRTRRQNLGFAFWVFYALRPALTKREPSRVGGRISAKPVERLRCHPTFPRCLGVCTTYTARDGEPAGLFKIAEDHCLPRSPCSVNSISGKMRVLGSKMTLSELKPPFWPIIRTWIVPDFVFPYRLDIKARRLQGDVWGGRTKSAAVRRARGST